MVFAIINIVIASAYGLLAWFFIKRIVLPTKSLKDNWRVILTFIFAGLFFIGCSHTHIDLALDAWSGHLHGHWNVWWNQLSHILQAIGGFGFYILATKWVQLNIFDKRSYQKVAQEVEENLDEPK